MNGLPFALNIFNNPIVRRYRRSQMRPVRLGVTIVITLVISSFLATMFYLPLRHRLGLTEVDAARAAFGPLLIFQAIILGIFGTAAIGGGILRESEEGMIEYQRLTPLSPLSKVLGYLFGLPIRQYVAFGIAACFSAFSIIVGKIPFEAWGSVYLVLFTSTILYHLLALITGQIIKSRWRAGLISIGLVLLLNLVLPFLANFGFSMFSHLTISPVAGANSSDLLPVAGRQFALWPWQAAAPDVPFWNMRISHLAFALVVQGSLIVTFILMLVRRWRDEEAHLLGKAYAVGWLVWLQIVLLGNVLPLLADGRVFMGVFATAGRMVSQFNRAGPAQAYVLVVIFGIVSFLILLPVISCITPREPTQMVAFRQRKKLGRRSIPWLGDGATSAPFVWLAAILSGAAWALLMHRLSTSNAYGLGEFPMEGWAVFIGIVLGLAAIFHFLLEAYSRQVAWMTLFLAGFLPLFASAVLGSISDRWNTTARYLISVSPLSAPWQPLDWLLQTDRLNLPVGRSDTPDFGPFTLFCLVHGVLCVALFIAWRRKRKAREARA